MEKKYKTIGIILLAALAVTALLLLGDEDDKADDYDWLSR
jgi:hypothetical protein